MQLFPHVFTLNHNEGLAVGRLSSNDGDSNENGKKATGLDRQNNNFVRASRFFVHFSAVAVRLGREIE